ncbi:MAG: SPOR domain-containing protein [Bacteroidota bacterium]
MPVSMYRSIAWISLAGILLLAGCGSGEEARREAPPPEVAPAPPPDTLLHFETRTDTLSAALPRVAAETPPDTGSPALRFMVQVGAFRNPANADRLRHLTRSRCDMTVMNNYDAGLGLYQIRIGFFETYEAAAVFRTRLRADHPGEYRDAWIVGLPR